MLIIMHPGATPTEIREVQLFINKRGLRNNIIKGELQIIIEVIGEKNTDLCDIEFFNGVEKIIQITPKYKLSSRAFQKEDTIININGAKFGGEYSSIIAGPCTIESFEQTDKTAAALQKSGVKILRGGAFKPRTSPYSFQGLGEEGLKIIRAVANKYKMAVISEITEVSQLEMFDHYVDIFQVGARNMQNFTLLKELGYTRKPVLIKRGSAATAEELLMSAEYVLSGGNKQVILCERGIRTFEKSTRNTLDLSIIPVIKKLSHLPIIVDPSHGTGSRDKVAPMAKAAMAAGCDGLTIEVHYNPNEAICDGAQSLYPEEYEKLLKDIKKIAQIVNKKLL